MPKEKPRKNNKNASGIEGLPHVSEIIHLAEERELSPYELLLLLVLRGSMHRRNVTCWKTERTLAREMRCSERAIRYAVKRVRELGIIKVTKKNKHNQYRFNYDGEGFIIEANCASINKKTGAPGASIQRHIMPSSSETEAPGALKSSNKEESNKRKKSIKGELKEKTLSHSPTNPPATKGKKKSSPLANRKNGDSFAQVVFDPEEYCWESYPPVRERFRRFPGIPAMPTEDDLEALYQGMVPRDTYLPYGYRENLEPIVSPFAKIKGFDIPGPPWFENQLIEFIKESIRRHWQGSEEAGGGFRRAFARAGRAGVLYRHGFLPEHPGLAQAVEDYYPKAEEELIRQGRLIDLRDRDPYDDLYVNEH